MELVAKAKQPHTSSSRGSSKPNVLRDDISVNLDETKEISTGSEANESGVSSTAKTKASEIMVKSKREGILYIAKESGHCQSDDNVVWLKLCRIQLSESDGKALLTFGYQLNDKHINLVQKLLKNRSPNTEGLVSTLFQSKDSHQKIHRGLQIIFCHSNHWITASNMNDENEIYDL